MLNYSTRILILISFIIAIFLRFYQIDTQGFLDGDEFDSRLFLDGYWKYHKLEGIRGSFWGRPTFFLLDIFLYNLFGIDPLIFLLVPNIEILSYSIFGVTYPFVILFLILFIVIFFFILRLIIKINNLKDQNCKIVQTIALEGMRKKNSGKKKVK